MISLMKQNLYQTKIRNEYVTKACCLVRCSGNDINSLIHYQRIFVFLGIQPLNVQRHEKHKSRSSITFSLIVIHLYKAGFLRLYHKNKIIFLRVLADTEFLKDFLYLYFKGFRVL